MFSFIEGILHKFVEEELEFEVSFKALQTRRALLYKGRATAPDEQPTPVQLMRREASKRNRVLLRVLDRPELLTWLDLSFNQLSVVSSELSTLDNLKILYLHGNQLADLQGTLAPLAPLLHLFNLTLHGNPVAVRRGYRRRVLSTLPQLRSLDFTNVIASETH